MATDNSFIPLDNPDFTTFDPTTIGVDTNITPEAITSKSQPLAFDSDTGILNINRNVILSNATIGDPNIIAHFTHPNIPGELVITSCQVGGTLYSNNVIIGSGSAQLLCDNTGTYIYNNLSVSGNINNNNLTTALNSKATTAQLSTLTDVVSAKADQSTLLTDYYNKNQTDSLLQGKANSNNVYTKSQVDSVLSQKADTTDLINKANINDVYSKSYSDLNYQTKADMSNYPTFDNIASLSSVYQSITNMSTYITQGSLTTYVTMGTLIDNYATQLDISTKVEQAFFESSILALNQSVYNNSVVYTNNQISGLSTVYQPLGSYITTLSSLSTVYQPVGNYITTLSTLSSYLTTANAASTYQPIANMATYITSGSLTAYQPVANMSNYMVKPWVSGRFNNALSILNSNGQQTFTVSKQSTGIYNVNWTNANPSGSNYNIYVSTRGPATISYGAPSSTSFQIYSYTGTSTAIDIPADCSFMAF